MFAPQRAFAELPKKPHVDLPKPIFHQNLDYGSESTFNPFSVIVNIGLMAYGTLGQDPKIQDLGSGGAAQRLVNAYIHPLDSIHGRGVGNYFLQEFLIGSIPLHPNTYLHLLGEGMVSRKLEEYMLARGVSRGWSKATAIATIVVAQQLNELNEQQSPLLECSDKTRGCRRLIDGADSLADSSFFNLAGILLFQLDPFAKLLNNKYIGFHYWPGQAAIDVRTGRIFNQAELSRLTVKLPWISWKLAFISGSPINVGLGLTVPVRNGHSVTVTYGNSSPFGNNVPYYSGPLIDVTDPRLASVASAHFHWDRNGSLMASLIARTDLKGFQLNVYPGFVHLGPGKRFGWYVNSNVETYFSAGLTFAYAPVVPGVQLW
jgi:hypothetical protein